MQSQAFSFLARLLRHGLKKIAHLNQVESLVSVPASYPASGSKATQLNGGFSTFGVSLNPSSNALGHLFGKQNQTSPTSPPFNQRNGLPGGKSVCTPYTASVKYLRSTFLVQGVCSGPIPDRLGISETAHLATNIILILRTVLDVIVSFRKCDISSYLLVGGATTWGQRTHEKVPTSMNLSWKAHKEFEPNSKIYKNIVNHVCASTRFKGFSGEEIRLADYSAAP